MPRGAAEKQAVPTAAPVLACSPRRVLLAVRAGLQATQSGRRRKFAQRLTAARRVQCPRQSAKAKRGWQQRRPHKPPQAAHLLMLQDAEEAWTRWQKTNAA
jgi:hypothetical protein